MEATMNIGGIGGAQPYVSALQGGPNAAQQTQLQLQEEERQQQETTQQAQAQDARTVSGSVTETRGSNLNIVV
ncbi:hypothetical protein [Azospirillum sp. A39]|uniref:hypothetical protein n=1 Tax=Azospirillum sp. A39 TaxID=3462279 RepID=UPI0040461F7B